MHKYGISTDVLNTYVADFHGTTVVLFDKTYPDQPTNKPVCTDCHGVHDIADVNDPTNGLAIRENLLVRCQKCHPDATSNFPDSWMSHYIPSTDKYPIVYYVNLFYKFFIPAVLGPMALLVLMDFGRATINRFKKQKPVIVQEPIEDATVESETVAETKTAEETGSDEELKPKQSEKKVAAETEEQKPEDVEQQKEETEPSEETKSSDEEENSNDR